MTEFFVFLAVAVALVGAAMWLDDTRARRDARKRNQARPWGDK